MNLEEFYAQIGGDYADTLQRLCNESMVKKFVKKYQDDPTCANLHNAVLQQDWEAAFRGQEPARCCGAAGRRNPQSDFGA